jgi:hypothetical protein
MFCSSCGIDSVEGLKYCTRCGANLSGSGGSSGQARAFPVALTAFVLLIMGGTTALGLTAPLLMARDLVNSGFMPKHVMMIFFCSSIVTVAVIALLTPVLMRLIGMSPPSATVKPVRQEKTAQSFDKPHSLSPPYPAVSVTENTTRSIDRQRVEGTIQT